jgi:hypothetical protein
MNATVPASGTVTVTIGATTYNDGQTITNFGWGNVHSGDNTQQISITNNRNEAVSASITATGLPAGWTLTLSSTAASIPAGQTVPVNMVLNVPSGFAAGSYSWSAVLNAASA